MYYGICHNIGKQQNTKIGRVNAMRFKRETQNSIQASNSTSKNRQSVVLKERKKHQGRLGAIFITLNK